MINFLASLKIQADYRDKLNFAASCLCPLQGIMEQQGSIAFQKRTPQNPDDFWHTGD